jgi:hypothetical protein
MTRISKTLTGLQPGQGYVIQVRGKNSSGETSEWSNAYTFSTPSEIIHTTNTIVQQQISGSGAIFISAPGTGSVVIDVNGINAKNNSGSTMFNLDNISGSAFFNGQIVSNSGNIGGWEIDSGYLYSGSGTNFVGLSSRTTDSASVYAIWAGSEDPETATFSIKDDGTVNASIINQILSGTSEFFSPYIFSGSSISQNVTFTRVLNDIPKVVATITSSEMGDEYFVPRVSNITASGFNMNLYNLNSASGTSASVVINWVATTL